MRLLYNLAAILAVVLIARNPARFEAPGKRFDANDFTMRY